MNNVEAIATFFDFYTHAYLSSACPLSLDEKYVHILCEECDLEETNNREQRVSPRKERKKNWKLSVDVEKL